jgi:hypothetical protein
MAPAADYMVGLYPLSHLDPGGDLSGCPAPYLFQIKSQWYSRRTAVGIDSGKSSAFPAHRGALIKSFLLVQLGSTDILT